MTRVVILLSVNGFVSAYFSSKKEAQKYIADWVARCAKRIQNGQYQDVETSILSNETWAVMAQYIIGMYIPSDEPSIQERALKAMEKVAEQGNEGNEWKGSNE